MSRPRRPHLDGNKMQERLCPAHWRHVKEPQGVKINPECPPLIMRWRFLHVKPLNIICVFFSGTERGRGPVGYFLCTNLLSKVPHWGEMIVNTAHTYARKICAEWKFLFRINAIVRTNSYEFVRGRMAYTHALRGIRTGIRKNFHAHWLPGIIFTELCYWSKCATYIVAELLPHFS